MAPYVETKSIADRLLDGLEYWICVLLHYIIGGGGGGRPIKLTKNCVNWKRDSRLTSMAMNQADNESGSVAAVVISDSSSSCDENDIISISSSMGACSYSSNEDDDERRAATVLLSDSEQEREREGQEEQTDERLRQLDWLDEEFERARWMDRLFSMDCSGLTRQPQTESAAETAPAFGSMRRSDCDRLHAGDDSGCNLCQICLTREKRYAIIPCGHIFCGYCCEKITSRVVVDVVAGEGMLSWPSVWKCHKCSGEVSCFLRIYNN